MVLLFTLWCSSNRSHIGLPTTDKWQVVLKMLLVFTAAYPRFTFPVLICHERHRSPSCRCRAWNWSLCPLILYELNALRFNSSNNGREPPNSTCTPLHQVFPSAQTTGWKLFYINLIGLYYFVVDDWIKVQLMRS